MIGQAEQAPGGDSFHRLAHQRRTPNHYFVYDHTEFTSD